MFKSKYGDFNQYRRGFSILGISSLVIIVVLFLHFSEKNKPSKFLQENSIILTENITQLCFQGNCFELEIADTPEKRTQGLMYRESLDKDKGMLFDSKEENMHYFWMKNTLIPLDIIRIDNNLEVLEIVSAPPCEQDPCPSYGPGRASRWVVELNSGTTKSIGLEIGKRIIFNNVEISKNGI